MRYTVCVLMGVSFEDPSQAMLSFDLMILPPPPQIVNCSYATVPRIERKLNIFIRKKLFRVAQ